MYFSIFYYIQFSILFISISIFYSISIYFLFISISILFLFVLFLFSILGFLGGSEVKASPWNSGDLGSILGSGKSSGEGNGNPLQYSCLENPMEGGDW